MYGSMIPGIFNSGKEISYLKLKLLTRYLK